MKRKIVLLAGFLSFIAIWWFRYYGLWKTNPSGSNQKITIEFLNWESTPEGSKFLNDLIRQFESKNPGIKVKNVVITKDYNRVLLTRFASGSPPDIFEIQAEIIHPFLKKNLLLNLSPLVKKSKVLKEKDFFPLSLINFRYDGKNFRQGDLYGFPKDWGTGVLIYNKDLFDKEGLSYPDGSWGEEEYLEAAIRLTKRDHSGRLIQVGIERPVHPFYTLLQKGGRIWSQDYKECLLNSQAAREAFQFDYDLKEKYRVALREQEIKEGLTESFGFKAGKAGMSLAWRYELPDMIKHIKYFRWDVAPLPVIGEKRVQLMHGPSGWAISAKTKYPEAAFKFLEFLAGKEGQIETAKLGWNIPSNREIAYSHFFLKNLRREDSERINRVFLDAIDYLDPSLLNPYLPLSRFYDILNSELDPEVITRKYGRKVAPALERAVERINKEIEENLEENL